MAEVQNNIDKKRMAKNTVLLYIRMLFLLLVGFYSVRLLLKYLGVEDYGLYNVVFGLVTAFSFFSGAMQSTVQRYLCYELSGGKTENARKVFSATLAMFGVLSIVVLLFAETAGLWFVCNKLNVPTGKAVLAQAVYQFSIFMVIFKVLQIPYIAAITSYENMRTFAQFSIFDAFLHLASVVVLRFIPENRLILFSAFYTLSNLVVLICYAVYCRKKYDICRVWLKADKQYIKEMSSFFSWNLFGAVANISKQQGLNLLLNVFCGVVLNATWGIATQVGSAVSHFYISFQQAFNPQILKSYNDPDRNAFFELLQSCSKYSFMLIWLVALPLLLQTEFFLKLWLGNELPESSVIFTQLMVVAIVIDAICAPLWVSVQATGNIRRYQVEISILICSTFVFSLIALKMGAPAYFVALINAVINFTTLLYRLIYLRKALGFHVLSYVMHSFIPMVLTASIGYFVCLFVKRFFSDGLMYVFVYLAAVTLLNLLVICLVGLSGKERRAFVEYCKKKVGK